MGDLKLTEELVEHLAPALSPVESIWLQDVSAAHLLATELAGSTQLSWIYLDTTKAPNDSANAFLSVFLGCWKGGHLQSLSVQGATPETVDILCCAADSRDFRVEELTIEYTPELSDEMMALKPRVQQSVWLCSSSTWCPYQNVMDFEY